MMILKRKEIIAAALVVLIGMAGYLNWSYQDTVSVQDGDSYVEAGKKLGEAQYVSSSKETEEPQADSQTEQKEEQSAEAWEEKKDNADGGQEQAATPTAYFESAKNDRETARANALEILNKTAENKEFDDEIRKKAQEEILNIASVTEKEAAVENIAKAKGYDKVCVFVNEDTVNISVKKDNFTESDAAKLQEIACSQLKISANNIKVVEVH